MAQLIAGVVALLVFATVTKIAVWLFSPDSDNSIFRAIAVNVVIVLGYFGLALLMTLIPPLASLALLVVWPFAVLKMAYGMSTFRSVLVALAIAALMYVVQHFLGAATAPTPAATAQWVVPRAHTATTV